MPQLLESAGLSSISSTIVQTARPAAAVAPIMQTDCSTTSAYDSTLCITNVTSMSYSAPVPQPKTTVSFLFNFGFFLIKIIHICMPN